MREKSKLAKKNGRIYFLYFYLIHDVIINLYFVQLAVIYGQRVYEYEIVSENGRRNSF